MRSERQCLAVGTSSEGTSGETGMTTIQEHSTSAWKTALSDKVTTNPVRRETKDEAKKECVAATVTNMIENKQLVLQQVNRTSIYNFWNLTHLTLTL